MQVKAFFRVAVLLPLVFMLAIWLWEPRLWQEGREMADYPFVIQATAFMKSWLLMGGGQYILSAAAVLYAMERMRSRSQLQLLFALSPMIFFLICGALSLLENLVLTALGVDTRSMAFGGVVLAVLTLTAGSVYAFVMSMVFIGLFRQRPRRRRPLPAFLPALGD